VKTWLQIFLIVAGLAFVIGSHVAQHMAIADPAPASHESARSKPPRVEARPAPKPQGPMSFGEYPCPGDCAEDKAGYDWAARNSITDPDSCTGTTAAFIEGCRVYAERRARELL